LDIMFHNAGIGNPPVSVLDMPPEECHRPVAVNQRGVFCGTKAAP
jgi:NAD(P)-dependent dehydrogenase (short-subunit alcohol dehydrogenase family)